MSLIASLNAEDRQAVLERVFVSPKDKAAGVWGWVYRSRFEQRPPNDKDWTVWLLLAGRGFGKTRTGAEFIRREVKAGRARRIALIGPTAAAVRSVMVEGESGLLSVYRQEDPPLYEPANHRILWDNGAVATLFSAAEPERLRGPQHDLAWIAADNSHVTMDATQMYGFGRAAGAYVSACVLRLRAIKDAIAAGADQAAIDAIDVTAGYPQASA